MTEHRQLLARGVTVLKGAGMDLADVFTSPVVFMNDLHHSGHAATAF